jgi:hypothetical protein
MHCTVVLVSQMYCTASNTICTYVTAVQLQKLYLGTYVKMYSHILHTQITNVKEVHLHGLSKRWDLL